MHPTTMCRGDRHRLAQAERMEIAADGVVVETLGLVDHQRDRFAGAPQSLGNDLVTRRQAIAPIEDEEH